MMSDLLASIIDAHRSINRWYGYEKINATIVSGGGFFALKGVIQDSDSRSMRNTSPCGPTGLPISALCSPLRGSQSRSSMRTLVAARYAPEDTFAGHQMSTPWDPLHRANFNDETGNVGEDSKQFLQN